MLESFIRAPIYLIVATVALFQLVTFCTWFSTSAIKPSGPEYLAIIRPFLVELNTAANTVFEARGLKLNLTHVLLMANLLALISICLAITKLKTTLSQQQQQPKQQSKAEKKSKQN